MRLCLAAALLSMTLTACASQPQSQTAGVLTRQATSERAVTQISVQEAKQWLADPQAKWLLLDLRTPAEIARGHVAGAAPLNFNAPDFRTRLEQMDRNQPTIIYCQSGNRSGKALEIMREMGFRNVYDVRGGILAWQAAGFPLVSPS
ncbi:MAG: rhodanese-like domain-containing protein [Candidatus Sericytochromatia bacterium]